MTRRATRASRPPSFCTGHGVLKHTLRRDLPARVDAGNDLADALLVEALETLVSLEVFEVAADGPLLAELLGLLRRELTAGEQPLDAGGVNAPALAFGERLAEVREIGEGFHHLDAALGFHLLLE